MEVSSCFRYFCCRYFFVNSPLILLLFIYHSTSNCAPGVDLKKCSSHFFSIKRKDGHMYVCYSTGVGNHQHCTGSILELALDAVVAGAKAIKKAVVNVISDIGRNIRRTAVGYLNHDATEFESLNFGDKLIKDLNEAAHLKLGLDITTGTAKASFGVVGDLGGKTVDFTKDQFNRMTGKGHIGTKTLGALGVAAGGTGAIATYVGGGVIAASVSGGGAVVGVVGTTLSVASSIMPWNWW